MKVRPFGPRVLVKVLDPAEEKKSSGGIVLPESAQSEKVVRGKVLRLGKDEKSEIKVGDVVLVSKYGGAELEWNGEKLLLVKTADILAVVRGK